jgi:S-ribosylhomocysteine lyase
MRGELFCYNFVINAPFNSSRFGYTWATFLRARRMDLQQRLWAFQVRELIDEHIVQIVLNVRCHLQQDWRVDVETEQVKMMLVHIASALGRIQRGHCASPLYADFLDEIQSAVVFPQVLQIHQKILKVIPLAIPEEEQTYFLANVYSLVLDQPQVLEQLG